MFAALNMRRLGRRELAEYAFEAMENRYACFLANHGLLTCGPNLSRCFFGSK